MPVSKKAVSFGQYVRSRREARGIEGQHLGRMIGKSASCISRWENGERSIPCAIIPEIARCLGCPDILTQKLAECPVYRTAVSHKRQQQQAA